MSALASSSPASSPPSWPSSSLAVPSTNTGRSTRTQAVSPQPQPVYSVLTHIPDACQAAVSRPIVWASFAANISTDIYLILIPIPMLWRSSLRTYKKIASTIVFSSGILVLVFATLKSASVLVVSPPLPTPSQP